MLESVKQSLKVPQYLRIILAYALYTIPSNQYTTVYIHNDMHLEIYIFLLFRKERVPRCDIQFRVHNANLDARKICMYTNASFAFVYKPYSNGSRMDWTYTITTYCYCCHSHTVYFQVFSELISVLCPYISK